MKRTASKTLSMIVTLCVMLTLFTQAAFANSNSPENTIIPLSTIQTVTYTLSPGETRTTYKYSVSSTCWNVGASYDVRTSGGSVSATLYGANSTSTANHSVASGSAYYGTDSGMDGADLDLSSSNSYPMYCTSVTNTSSKTVTVQISIYAD